MASATSVAVMAALIALAAALSTAHAQQLRGAPRDAAPTALDLSKYAGSDHTLMFVGAHPDDIATTVGGTRRHVLCRSGVLAAVRAGAQLPTNARLCRDRGAGDATRHQLCVRGHHQRGQGLPQGASGVHWLCAPSIATCPHLRAGDCRRLAESHHDIAAPCPDPILRATELGQGPRRPARERRYAGLRGTPRRGGRC